jgi:hypothetical protein
MLCDSEVPACRRAVLARNGPRFFFSSFLNKCLSICLFWPRRLMLSHHRLKSDFRFPGLGVLRFFASTCGCPSPLIRMLPPVPLPIFVQPVTRRRYLPLLYFYPCRASVPPQPPSPVAASHLPMAAAAPSPPPQRSSASSSASVLVSSFPRFLLVALDCQLSARSPSLTPVFRQLCTIHLTYLFSVFYKDARVGAWSH